jgi:hypothetical protein
MKEPTPAVAPLEAPTLEGRARRRASSPRQRGRRIAQAAYYAIAAALAVAGTVEVSRQVFFVPPEPASYPTCHDGLRALSTAVERARRAAPGTDGEDAALARFRQELAPEWARRDAVATMCKGSPGDEATLDAIERLRYAEEHAVRREAGDLAPLRRRVQAIVDSTLSPPPASPSLKAP